MSSKTCFGETKVSADALKDNTSGSETLM
jgi:hypothetical protein